MNKEQIKSILRWLGTAFGSGIAGFLMARNWFTADQVTSIMNLLSSEVFLSFAASVIMAILGLMTHTQDNAVAVAVDIAKDPASPVKGVITENNMAGRALAASIPGPRIAAAGTPEAQSLAVH